MHSPPVELGMPGRVLQYLEQAVAHWIMRHGALVFMIPSVYTGAGIAAEAVCMQDYVAEIDALVLQGGADVSPQSYGQEPRVPHATGDRVRDLYELDMVRECMARDKPVLGICRGAQLINVALGGTLVQDIDSEIPDATKHNDVHAYDRHWHDVVIEPGSGLARLYPGVRRASVNSIHHQSVDRLGEGLVVEARSPADNVVEAIRGTGDRYIAGVQWHPEFHAQHAAGLLDGGPLLSEFLCEAQRRRASGH